MWRALTAFVILSVAACGKGPEADWRAGETGYVSRVTDGDTLALNTGQVVRLVSIEAPSFGYRGREDMPYAEGAKRQLEALALGQPVQLYYPGITRDRYDRALAQVRVLPKTGKAFWLNEALVQEGAAWVRLYPDTAAGSDGFWKVERSAREARRGLWAKKPPVYSGGATLPSSGFVILQTGVSGANPVGGKCEFSLDQSALKATVSLNASGACPVQDGKTYEVRGWISKRGLNISSHENVRSLQKP